MITTKELLHNNANAQMCITSCLNLTAGSKSTCENLAQADHRDQRPIATVPSVPHPEQHKANATTLPPVTRTLQLGPDSGSCGDSQQRSTCDDRRDKKRATIEDGSLADSASPLRDLFSSRPSSRSSRSKISKRSHPSSKQLWPENTTSFPESSGVTPPFASIQTQTSRAQKLRPHPKKCFPVTAQFSQKPPRRILGSNASFPILSRQDSEYDIIMQPRTKPISQGQLIAEVKGIYAGLVKVEAQCIDIDNKQATLAQAGPQPELNNELWQAIIARHRTLLHEHYDFFLTSQCPSASPDLRRLALRYAMPARMWQYGIHSLLELLRYRLPESLDHMLAFIYFAYSIIALLYKTVPAFEDTWIECLGDISRYRMAIEDDDIRDRQVWTAVARQWYSKISDQIPTTGRFYHHLAILAWPNALQQLFYYTKSLCVGDPYTSTRESILTLFKPVLNSDNDHGRYSPPPLDAAFIKAHGLLFTNRDIEKFDLVVKEFLDLLDNQIGRVTRKFMEQGYYIAIANSIAMLGFASKENPVVQAMAEVPAGEPEVDMSGDDSPAMKSFERAKYLSNKTLEIVLHRIGDPNVLPFIHVTLVFMYHLARHHHAMKLLEASFPWQSLTVMLNTLLAPYSTQARIESPDFPLPIKDTVRPFPDDFAMRGLVWADGYHPEKWFTSHELDVSEEPREVASMTDDRKERILWIACCIARLGSKLQYDKASKRFSVRSGKLYPACSEAV